MVVSSSKFIKVYTGVIAVFTFIHSQITLSFLFFLEGQARNDSYVTLHGFLVLVALFGPFKPGPDGCLQKVTST